MSARQVAAGMIPNLGTTPLLDAARAKGCDGVTGRAMSAGQATPAAARLGIAAWGE